MSVLRPAIGRRLGIIGLSSGLLLLFAWVAPLSAQGESSVAQGFQTNDPNVVTGAIVSLTSGTPNTVELATSDKADQMIGVAGSKSLIELSSGTGGSVQVVTSGSTLALVSDLNGSVGVGDRITASPIAGVGMKATTSTLVIGTAEANLSSQSTKEQAITDTKGKQKTVHIGAVPLQVDKVFYQPPDTPTSFLPNAVQDFANSVAGHEVSPVRVMVAGILIAMLFVIVTVLLYSTVKSSIISIGRNPLSENEVHKSLLEVGITIAGVLVFTVVVVYLILIT